MKEEAACPYCGEMTALELPLDYAPVYAKCTSCGKKIIAERLSKGFQVLTIEDAPCCSDPECREQEMSASDED